MDHAWFFTSQGGGARSICDPRVGLQSATDEDHGTDPAPKLTVTERSGTTLKIQWDAFAESGWYSVDVLTGQPSCTSFPEHHTTREANATSVELTQLTPSTVYHIHIHALAGPGGKIVGDTKSQTAFVSTLAPGAAATPAVATDYQVCN